MDPAVPQSTSRQGMKPASTNYARGGAEAREPARREDTVDRESETSIPASDPPPHGGRIGCPRRIEEKEHEKEDESSRTAARRMRGRTDADRCAGVQAADPARGLGDHERGRDAACSAEGSAGLEDRGHRAER